MRWSRGGWRSVGGLRSARMHDCVEAVAWSGVGVLEDTALQWSLFFF